MVLVAIKFWFTQLQLIVCQAKITLVKIRVHVKGEGIKHPKTSFAALIKVQVAEDA